MFRSRRLPVKDRLQAGKNTLVVFHSPVMLMMPKVKALRLPTVGQVQIVSEGHCHRSLHSQSPYHYGWDWGPRYVTEASGCQKLIAWDDLRIDNFHIRQEKISKDEAGLLAEFDVVARKSADVTLTVEHDGANGKKVPAAEQKSHLDEGLNHITIAFRIANPSLWYPNGYGPQTLYKFSATLSAGTAKKPMVEDRAELRTGLRSLEWHVSPTSGAKTSPHVNGIPVFAERRRFRPRLATRVTPAQHRQILQSARDAHMNMIRHWGGGYYETDDFYDIATNSHYGVAGLHVRRRHGSRRLAFQENVREE
jgi:beta-mannosidase